MTCGIYKIYFSNTDKVYIGSSSDIDKRIKQHKAMLSNDCHHSYKLQEYYNKNNDKIEFSIIEECQEIDKLRREAYWVNTYDALRNGFNVSEIMLEDCIRYPGADLAFIGIPEALEIDFKYMLDNNISHSEIITYSYLKYAIEHCNNALVEFCVSQEDIAKTLNLSSATVKTYIKNLVDKGKIVVYKGLSHNRNSYRLN